MDWSKDNTWKQRAKEKKKIYKRYLDFAKEAQVIKQLPAIHEAVFSKINCLECANCCKNHSPTFKATDIKRISKHLNLKESDLIVKYLKLDEENDWVMKTQPCTFLNNDNTCQIYEVRPSDCARFPYTNEDVFIKRKNLTLINAGVCPAVSMVLNILNNIS
jgi:uncharacterized protein